MSHGRVVILARTLPEARTARRELTPTLPDLKGALLASTHGGRWLDGLRVHRVYVLPGAEDGPHYSLCLAVLRRSLLKTPGADAVIRYLPDLEGPGRES